MKELICICCPKGCRLQVYEQHGFSVSGNACPKGAAYGKEELTHPVRIVTSTVALSGALLPRCPVKTEEAVPKEKMSAVLRALSTVRCQAPVSLGEIILENVADTGVNIVATRSFSAL